MTDTEKIKLKKDLKQFACDILLDRIKSSKIAMEEAQLAANEEGKSSVGDKYETSRAMSQIERDIHAKQLESAQRELNIIQQTDVSLFHNHVEQGSIVISGNEKYFFLSGLGPKETPMGKIFFLSITSPLGKLFSGKRAGEKIKFDSREIAIENLF